MLWVSISGAVSGYSVFDFPHIRASNHPKSNSVFCGGWTLSQVPWGERQGAPWTQFVTWLYLVFGFMKNFFNTHHFFFDRQHLSDIVFTLNFKNNHTRISH